VGVWGVGIGVEVGLTIEVVTIGGGVIFFAVMIVGEV